MTRFVFLLALSLVPLTASAGPSRAQAPAAQANPIGTAVLGFKERVAAYVKVHNEAESKVPKLKETNDPAKVQSHGAALAEMIKKLRPEAKEGDIFGDEFRAVLAREVRRDFLGRSAADRKALMEELPPKMKVGVNMKYPTDKPLATFPARLLQKLPELPPQLEYRIVDHHIVLRDVTANVIADVARNVVPTTSS
jgi:hypothetical protein